MAKERDYREERLNESPQRKKARAARNRARAAMLKKLTDKYGRTVAERMLKNAHVDHKKPLALGGSNDASNLRLRDPKENVSDKKGLFAGKRTTRPKKVRG